MMMKKVAISIMLAVSSVALAASTSAIAKEDSAKAAKVPSGKPSKGAQKVLAELQKAGAAKDWALVKTKIAEAEALPGLNSFDTYFINQYKYNMGIELKDDALMAAGLEVMAGSEFVAADQKPKILRNLLAMSDQAKDYAKAKGYAERYLQLVPDDVNVQSYLVDQMIRAKDYAGADARFSQIIKSGEAAGKPAEEYVYIRLAAAREQAKSPLLPEALANLVAHYPTGRNWNFLLENFQTRTAMIGRAGLDLFRLMNATGALTSAAAVFDAAQTALDAGVPADAKAFLEKGQGTGLLSERKTDTAQLMKLAQTALATEESPAKQEAAATTGDRLASVGQLYLSLGNYPKAIDVLTRALAKPIRTKNESTIRLGIAKLMGGDTAGAKATWASVTGDQKMIELAKLWTLHADTRQ